MSLLRRTLAISAVLSLAAGFVAADSPPAFAPKPGQAGDLPAVFQDDFERDDLSRWTFTDGKAWRITRSDGNRVLDQHQGSKYEPKVRSPLNIALVQGVDVGDFVLDLQVRSTTRDYGHRDVCLVFGHQDPSHFYYVHLGKEADEHAHSIFLVNDKPRVSIAETRTKGTPWSNGWHHLRVIRKTADGLIQVYFDDMATPVMTAHDKSFKHGGIGVGTFDDTGQFDSLQVWGDAFKPGP